MLTHKYEPAPSDDSMHTSSIPGQREGSSAWLEKGGASHKPLTLLCTLDKYEAVWLRVLGPGPSLEFKADELSPKSH